LINDAVIYFIFRPNNQVFLVYWKPLYFIWNIQHNYFVARLPFFVFTLFFKFLLNSYQILILQRHYKKLKLKFHLDPEDNLTVIIQVPIKQHWLHINLIVILMEWVYNIYEINFWLFLLKPRILHVTVVQIYLKHIQVQEAPFFKELGPESILAFLLQVQKQLPVIWDRNWNSVRVCKWAEVSSRFQNSRLIVHKIHVFRKVYRDK
jgi:hypothetical protein